MLGRQYVAHNATEDVTTLLALVQHCNFSDEDIQSHSFTTISCKAVFDQNLQKAIHLQTFSDMIQAGCISKSMAEKISKSGLNIHHLRTAFLRNNTHGLSDLLSEHAYGQIRVTRSKKVIGKILQYFESR